MDKLTKEDYNNEPIFYCSECLSLRIRSLDDIDYCDKCGSTSIEEANIKDWEAMYTKKYNENYINLK